MTLEQQIPLSLGLRRPGALHHSAATKAKLALQSLLIFNLVIFEVQHSRLMKPLTADLSYATLC